MASELRCVWKMGCLLPWIVILATGCGEIAKEADSPKDGEDTATVDEALTQTACDTSFNHGGSIVEQGFDMDVSCGCHAGFRHKQFSAWNDGPGRCTVNRWISATDPNNCGVNVHVTNSGGGLTGTCHVHVDEYDRCQIGGPLNKEDTCIEQICASDSYCCSTAWDATCVQEVSTVCNLLICPDRCPHPECTVGGSLPSSCSDSVAAICAIDNYCCTTAWDGQCVSEVQSIAHKSCQG